jgi:hypothetical protein
MSAANSAARDFQVLTESTAVNASLPLQAVCGVVLARTSHVGQGVPTSKLSASIRKYGNVFRSTKHHALLTRR